MDLRGSMRFGISKVNSLSVNTFPLQEKKTIKRRSVQILIKNLRRKLFSGDFETALVYLLRLMDVQVQYYYIVDVLSDTYGVFVSQTDLLLRLYEFIIKYDLRIPGKDYWKKEFISYLLHETRDFERVLMFLSEYRSDGCYYSAMRAVAQHERFLATGSSGEHSESKGQIENSIALAKEPENFILLYFVNIFSDDLVYVAETLEKARIDEAFEIHFRSAVGFPVSMNLLVKAVQRDPCNKELYWKFYRAAAKPNVDARNPSDEANVFQTFLVLIEQHSESPQFWEQFRLYLEGQLANLKLFRESVSKFGPWFRQAYFEGRRDKNARRCRELLF